MRLPPPVATAAHLRSQAMDPARHWFPPAGPAGEVRCPPTPPPAAPPLPPWNRGLPATPLVAPGRVSLTSMEDKAYLVTGRQGGHPPPLGHRVLT